MVQIDIITFKYVLFNVFVIVLSFVLINKVFWLPLLAINGYSNLYFINSAVLNFFMTKIIIAGLNFGAFDEKASPLAFHA